MSQLKEWIWKHFSFPELISEGNCFAQSSIFLSFSSVQRCQKKCQDIKKTAFSVKSLRKFNVSKLNSLPVNVKFPKTENSPKTRFWKKSGKPQHHKSHKSNDHFNLTNFFRQLIWVYFYSYRNRIWRRRFYCVQWLQTSCRVSYSSDTKKTLWTTHNAKFIACGIDQ